MAEIARFNFLTYWKKCPFCRSRKNVKLVPEYSDYGYIMRHWAYHDECLEEVLCHPETHGHKMVDYMLGITERIKQHQYRINCKRKSVEAQYEKAKNVCLEEVLGK